MIYVDTTILRIDAWLYNIGIRHLRHMRDGGMTLTAFFTGKRCVVGYQSTDMLAG